MIPVHQSGAARIGDALGMVPFFMAVAEKHKEPVLIDDEFSAIVKPLLSEMPIHFSDSVENPAYTINVGQALSFVHGGHSLHMAQSYFEMTKLGAPPELPIKMPLLSTPSPVSPGGIIISPFSASDHGHNKCWYDDRWARVIRDLQDEYSLPVYVIGSAEHDTSPYTGAIPVLGQPLTSILSMLRECRLFISVDNGISHLAHFGGVHHRHVLLYPICLNPCWVPNPGASIIRQHQIHIQAETVLAAAHDVLGRQ